MKTRFYKNIIFVTLVFSTLAFSCHAFGAGEGEGHSHMHEYEEAAKGPNGGRLLEHDGFIVELAIFEKGVPPEFHAYLRDASGPINPVDASLSVVLTRLGNIQDNIRFAAEKDFLRGGMTIYEPHSFEVNVYAAYQGKRYEWHYDNFEGRVSIPVDIANAMDIKTSIAGAETLEETLDVFGHVILPAEAEHPVYARFSGLIKQVHVQLGESVRVGQKLLTVESNKSLKNYVITSPIDGVVSMMNARQNMLAQEDSLMTIVDNTQAVVELDIFPNNKFLVKKGQPVKVFIRGNAKAISGHVVYLGSAVNVHQRFPVRVVLNNDNADGAEALLPGTFVSAKITVDSYDVGLAVKKDAIQAFRDFSVVYTKFGDTYEVRMLDLGREAGPWVEVLGGLPAGAEYVTKNSYVIKADIEKSGASHDH